MSRGSNGNGAEAPPPQDLDAEVAVLGSALNSEASADRAVASLRPEDFYLDKHRLIFSAIAHRRKEGEPV